MPHIASRFSGKLQEEISKKIFVKDQRPIMYYTSALLNYRIEKAFNNNEVGQVYIKFKYHLQMIIAHLIWKDVKRPQFNSYKMDEYCEILIKAIEEDCVFKELLNTAKECIDSVIRNLNDTEANKTSGVVNDLLLYSEIQWSEKDVNQAKYFVRVIDDYLIPFKNMRIDGDLRYNFIKNLVYLQQFTNDNKVARCLIDSHFFSEINCKLDENDRSNRMNNASIVCKEYEQIIRVLKGKIELASKYIKNIA